MLSDFIKARKNIPKNLTVYSVAGTENYDSDGLVPLNSVEAEKYVYQGQVKHYTEITVTGVNAEHSDLPQNQQIVDLIQKYILTSDYPAPGAGTGSSAGKTIKLSASSVYRMICFLVK